MNNLKRLVSMLLCMTFLFTSIGVFAEDAAEAVVTEEAATEEVAAAEEVAEETVEEPDPIDIDWESIGLLETLGIIDKVDEASAQAFLGEQMSRAEFAVALVKFANMTDTVGGENKFKDVIKGSYEEPYINAAVGMGLIASVSDGYFYPKYPISYKDAAQALVMSLGYTSLAEINDSWHIQAKKIGLMKGIDTGATFTRAQSYTMLFNALHAEVMEVTSLEGKYANYEAREGVDALYRFFDIRHDEGVIMSAGGVDISTGLLSTSKDYLKVNGKEYYYGAHDVNKYLGRNAVVYYNDNNDAIYVRFDRNEELDLPADEMISYANYTYTYGDNKKLAKISAPPKVILNNSIYTGEYLENIMKPVSGSVTLVDNNRDGVFDFVFIKAYNDYYVKSLITSSYTVVPAYSYDVTGDGVADMPVLNPDLYDVEIYDANNNLVDFSAIQAGNVISVATSGKKVQAYISTNAVTGVISQMSTLNGKEAWRIEGADYTKAPSLVKELANASTKLDTVQLGTNYKFYLNTYGEIVYYEEVTAVTGDDKFYAVIVAAKKEGLDAKVTVKAFAKVFGGFESLTLPSRITFNGSNATPEFVYNSLNRDGVDGFRAEAGRIYPQPVKMKVNENNEITYIAQASVKEYYDSMDAWGSYTLPEITEPNSFPSYEPEFYLYMGDPTYSGQHFAYRGIIGQSVTKGTKATIDKHPYSIQSSGRDYWRAMMPGKNITTYQIPMYMDSTNATTIGKIAPEKEDFFAMSSIPRAAGFKMMAYKEDPDSRAATFVMNLVSADAASTVGNNFNLRLVTEITTEYVNEEPVTVVNTHAGKFYVKTGTIDLNALPFYSYTQLPMNNPITGEATYKVKPGDIINISVDTLNYAKAIEPVFDATNGWFLGDYQQGNKNNLSSGENKIYNNRSHPFCYGTREADNIHKLEWVLLENFDQVNGALEGLGYKVNTRYPMNDPKEGLPKYDQMQATKVFTQTPGSCTAVMLGRNGVITTRNATGTDFVTDEDAPGEASILLLAQRYMSLNGASFLYPAEMTKNWPKSPAELETIINANYGANQ